MESPNRHRVTALQHGRVTSGLLVIRPEPSSRLVETPATELLARYGQKRQTLFLLNDRAYRLS